MSVSAQHDLLLALAAEVAHRAVAAAEEHNLKTATYEDTVEVEGATWEVEAIYYRPKGMVVLTGTLQKNLDGNMPAFIQHMIGKHLDNDGDWNYGVPIGWLPKAEVPSA